MTESYAFGIFRLDPNSQDLRADGRRVKLTAKAFAILALLVERAPATVLRADFEAIVWPEGFIEPANLTQTIYMIRKTLAAYSTELLIETVNGRGYRLCVPARPSSLVETQTSALLERPPRPRGLLWRLASLTLLLGISLISNAPQPNHHEHVVTSALHPHARSYTAASHA